jgi:2-oxoisovalerate dehydrogenase E2 component (dihydrolipoyl transacylase)
MPLRLRGGHPPVLSRRAGERWLDAATIGAAAALGCIGFAAMLALDREPPSPPLGPAQAAPAGDAQGPRPRAAPDLPARIAPERRPVRRKHERRRVRRPATTVVRPRVAAPTVVTSTPTPRAAEPAPLATPPPAHAPSAPARPKPRPPATDGSGQTFDSSG